MKLSDFDYEYPKELIAQRPLAERDASRMMVVSRASKSWSHSVVSELPEILREGDLLVFNDSKVVPARLFGKRATGETIELLVVEKATLPLCKGEAEGVEHCLPPPPYKGGGIWRCLLKKAKRIRSGEKFFFGMQATATAGERDGIFLLVEFGVGALELAIKHHGAPPLPPYIEREGLAAYTDEDRERYQTVFADKSGSAAAPTAGLHFSEALLGRLRERGVNTASVTLHVGIDTFRPVRALDTSEHRMHGERYEVTEQTAELVDRAKAEGRRVIACGTTAIRALESARQEGVRGALSGTTRLFITPGYRFCAVDALLTNFHLPRSTLIMLVSAFAGREFILSCYAEAIRERYRLFSYGDCMLIM
ncbi:MAG: tRNA preQ1(34) S-adenosylmethionine ribosyltransferase-isomerase QueA [Pseudomonadota bacterium]